MTYNCSAYDVSTTQAVETVLQVTDFDLFPGWRQACSTLSGEAGQRATAPCQPRSHEGAQPAHRVASMLLHTVFSCPIMFTKCLPVSPASGERRRRRRKKAMTPEMKLKGPVKLEAHGSVVSTLGVVL